MPLVFPTSSLRPGGTAEFSRGCQPTDDRRTSTKSRVAATERFSPISVAATRLMHSILTAFRGLTPTAKLPCRYAAEEAARTYVERTT